MKKTLLLAGSLALGTPALSQDGPIIHDAEYYILLAERGEQWTQDDAAVDKRLRTSANRTAANHRTSSIS
ncbi:MAG: hypothetical protein AAF678_03015 [Pseudomonadota bacterium]